MEFLFPYTLPVIDTVRYLSILWVWQSVSLSNFAFVNENNFSHFNLHLLVRIIFYVLLADGIFCLITCLFLSSIFILHFSIYFIDLEKFLSHIVCILILCQLKQTKKKPSQTNYPSLWHSVYSFVVSLSCRTVLVLLYSDLSNTLHFELLCLVQQILESEVRVIFSIIFLEKFSFFSCDLQFTWNAFCSKAVSNFVLLPHGRPTVLVPLFLWSVLTLSVPKGTLDTSRFSCICFSAPDSIEMIGLLKSITHCLDDYTVRIRFGIRFWWS